MTHLATGQQYLPDVGFTQGWEFPDDGGSRGWGIPPVIGFDPEEWMGEGATDDREWFLANWWGGQWLEAEVKPLFEDWQKTPGNALYVSTNPTDGIGAGGEYFDWWVPVLPSRQYVVRYGKKITDAYLPYAKLYVRILWSGFNKGASFAESKIGYDDNAPGVYTYEQQVNPPTREVGWSQDAYWARVMIYAMGAGGSSFGASVAGFIDDVEFAVLNEPPSELSDPGQVDPGSIESEVGLWMYDALEPLQAHEQRLGYPLLALTDAVGSMFQPTYDIVSDANIMLDPDRTPVGWIPWLAQFVGQPLPGAQLPGEADFQYRARMLPYIKDPPHRRRGTVPSILEEVKSFLNPGANVYAVERVGGNLYIGSIGVIATQMKAGVTIAQIQARIEQIAPAGRIITVSAITGGDWNSLKVTHTDWADVLSTYDDWAEVKANPTL